MNGAFRMHLGVIEVKMLFKVIELDGYIVS